MAMTERDYEASEAKRDPRSHHVMKRLQILREHAETIRQSTGTAADKIVGPQAPVALANGATSPPKAAGFFAEIDDVISAIESTLSVASDNLRRFEREF